MQRIPSISVCFLTKGILRGALKHTAKSLFLDSHCPQFYYWGSGWRSRTGEGRAGGGGGGGDVGALFHLE